MQSNNLLYIPTISFIIQYLCNKKPIHILYVRIETPCLFQRRVKTLFPKPYKTDGKQMSNILTYIIPNHNKELEIKSLPWTTKIKSTRNQFNIPLFECIVNNCFILNINERTCIIVQHKKGKKRKRAYKLRSFN